MSARTGGSFGGGQCGKLIPFRAPPRESISQAAPSKHGQLVAAVEYLISIDARCLACDRKPEAMFRSDRVDQMGVRFVFMCHGNKQVVEIREGDMRSLQTRDFIGRIANEITRLFQHDSGPDMKELLRYNREGWR